MECYLADDDLLPNESGYFELRDGFYKREAAQEEQDQREEEWVAKTAPEEEEDEEEFEDDPDFPDWL